MSYFGVTVETIDCIKPHTNADRLEIGSLIGMNYNFVVPKGSFKSGEKVIYFPIDALLPPAILAKLGLIGKLAGKDKNRIKTIRLRGEISQGIIASIQSVQELLTETIQVDFKDKEDKEAYGIHLATSLGVEKYEVPEVFTQSGKLHTLPLGLSIYDIEGADREVEMLERLMNEVVEISEKIEGSNFSSSAIYENNEIHYWVNQRRHTIVIDGTQENNSWWKAATTDGYLECVKFLAQQEEYRGQPITIYGELVGPGVQGNYYGFKTISALAFDIKVGEEFIDPLKRYELINSTNNNKNINTMINHVPIICNSMTLREWLNGKSIREMADGKSMLANVAREGIVIKPLRNLKFGNRRLILKQRGPIYLAKSEN